VLPSGDLSFEGLFVGDAAAQTLGCQNGEFGFGHVEPASMFSATDWTGCDATFDPCGEVDDTDEEPVRFFFHFDCSGTHRR
jgi:hypothetical protein